jgi:GTP cyclohydrolase I
VRESLAAVAGVNLDALVERRAPVPAQVVEHAVRVLLYSSGDPDPGREGLGDTPARFAKAWREMLRGYRADPADILVRDFEGEGYDELLIECGIPFTSLCEHHLLPFAGVAHVGYITNGRVVGLSKLARLVVDVFAPRLQMQERITVQIANAIQQYLDPKGVIVVLEARHLCMECRGVKVAGAVTVTSALRGALRDKPAARAEALALIANTTRRDHR